MPRFSILMPTRNRADLLRYALQTALAQSFQDYEIVVSDNQSDDDTAAVVRELSTERVRYVRTPRAFSMPDSWEFALSHARGEYITVLADDDGILPELLHEANHVIEEHAARIASWAHLQYRDMPFGDNRRRNQLAIIPFTGKVLLRDSRRELKRLFAFQETIGAPKMLNCFCHRQVIQAIKERQGRFFMPIAPDYSSCVAMLAMEAGYTFIDRPLGIAGLVSKTKSKRVIHQFLDEFGDTRLFARVPLQAAITCSGIAETLLNVRDGLSRELQCLELNWPEYFLRCLDEIREFLEFGVYADVALREFEGVFKRQAFPVRAAFYRKRIARRIQGLGRGILHNVIRTCPWLGEMKAKARGQRIGTTIVIDGDRVGFRNVGDCVRMWPTLKEKVNGTTCCPARNEKIGI